MIRSNACHSLPPEDGIVLGQQTPKPLPAWLREGLKRAERDKQKKLLKKAKLHGTEEACKAQGATKGPEKLVGLILTFI